MKQIKLTIQTRAFILAAIVVGVLLPFVPLLLWSVSFRWLYPSVLPESLSLRAWQYVFSPRAQVLSALGYSTLVALLVTTLSIVIGLPAGRALGLYKFRGKTA
ncbi:MAG: hypothetical protein KC434_20655, partial [Anaerolineales bacterium]|nr:hypothetical protein [Anaerolineales bacterium]